MSEKWRRFRQQFDIYLTASGIDKNKENVKAMALLHVFGTDGMKIKVKKTLFKNLKFIVTHEKFWHTKDICSLQELIKGVKILMVTSQICETKHEHVSLDLFMIN